MSVNEALSVNGVSLKKKEMSKAKGYDRLLLIRILYLGTRRKDIKDDF